MQDRIAKMHEVIQHAEDCSYPDSRPKLINALHSQASIIQELQARNEELEKALEVITLTQIVANAKIALDKQCP